MSRSSKTQKHISYLWVKLIACLMYRKRAALVAKARKIEALEKEIELLKARQSLRTASVSEWSHPSEMEELPPTGPLLQNERPVQSSIFSAFSNPASIEYPEVPGVPYHLAANSEGSPSTTSLLTRSQKRNRSCFETETPTTADFLNTGALCLEESELFFNAFFSGCDRYVPIFDPRYDSMQSIRNRSDLLFATICSVGCRVLNGTNSRWRALNFHSQRMLDAAIANLAMGSLETVQALLVQACYASERSLLISIATRMALDLGFPEAYDTLTTQFVSREHRRNDGIEGLSEKDGILMRRTRVWLHLLVMSHILHVDAGGLPTFKFRGASRRCRVILQSQLSTGMDHYLFAQVELNVLRAKIYSSLSQCTTLEDQEIIDLVRDAKIDIDVWFNDWMLISEKHHQEMPWFAPNLLVQRCWADSMALCRAVRASGVENVNAMSQTQKNILLMAKDSLKQHLDIIVEEPRLYLNSLRYAMDFVWAKNTFCCLLLLKLSMLLPDGDEQRSREFSHELVEKGSILLNELGKVAAGGPKDDARSNTSVLYLQLLKLSIQKYKQGLDPCSEDYQESALYRADSYLAQKTPCRPNEGVQTDLESFVPEQFVFEWDFPGLTLFSSPTTEADRGYFASQTGG
ncbi:hypothetical protein G7Z17_g4384 [Cylindrodendrum hubeiense]|uniref:Transcription factor domain-containing protein n=1 Tax=Cylindrodendrum hubeiense TaxID=595255 RepID=A0A9P5H8X8_9HYPO|nr:hypothetical protein G7Z17_g4384 [Cylindrodendrum hubeiense]